MGEGAKCMHRSQEVEAICSDWETARPSWEDTRWELPPSPKDSKREQGAWTRLDVSSVEGRVQGLNEEWGVTTGHIP